jgi:hypothetical protein
LSQSLLRPLVRRLGALADDALESDLHRVLEHQLAFCLDVINISEARRVFAYEFAQSRLRSSSGNARPEDWFAIGVCAAGDCLLVLAVSIATR